MRVFGLIGYPLTHSFSADYLNSKFRKAGLDDHIYKLFPIEHISGLLNILDSEPALAGLNVTIPYKEKVISFLDELSPEAEQIGAVNCISIRNGKLTGYNTDCYGFEEACLRQIIDADSSALLLGNGGASKAVQYVLKKNGISFQVVSRKKSDSIIPYSELNSEIITNYRVIINTTSQGMFPDLATTPPIDFSFITPAHLLIDLIYNPEVTQFLKEGQIIGCSIINGLPMFRFQAEKAWEIWESDR
jgi:shikimate dehydrogenase